MNLTKEIEKLIYWYIPALFISNILGASFTAEIKAINGVTPFLSYGLVITDWLIRSVDNIIIAIWLYLFAKKLNEKYILWAFFGLVAHIFAVVTFLVLKLLEEINLTNVTEKDIDNNEVSNKPSKLKLFIWSK